MSFMSQWVTEMSPEHTLSARPLPNPSGLASLLGFHLWKRIIATVFFSTKICKIRRHALESCALSLVFWMLVVSWCGKAEHRCVFTLNFSLLQADQTLSPQYVFGFLKVCCVTCISGFHSNKARAPNMENCTSHNKKKHLELLHCNTALLVEITDKHIHIDTYTQRYTTHTAFRVN